MYTYMDVLSEINLIIGDAIQANKCLTLAKIKGCRVRDWIVGKRGIRISRILYSTCVNED